jgi:hypothetical protein
MRNERKRLKTVTVVHLLGENPISPLTTTGQRTFLLFSPFLKVSFASVGGGKTTFAVGPKSTTSYVKYEKWVLIKMPPLHNETSNARERTDVAMPIQTILMSRRLTGQIIQPSKVDSSEY